ncbi:amino acid ABC transporter substrate-binding protein [uncultured Agrobacterium sp.]|uniref:amino acid ABC transporter substrate-binding protein n=1 Tax=uncultured Agrobacterium sp. TaxID=157277 RepID=UPI00258A45CD|nr:amino acid ABC transporter substrate-binding protein [uncultured Agrobacterium sp.]
MMARVLLLGSIVMVGAMTSIAAKAAEQTFNTPTLERIAQTGKIRIGYGATAPFSFRTEEGQVIGYSIDICRRMVDRLKDKLKLPKIDIEFVARTPSNRVQLLNDGSMDIECNASTNSVERRKSASFAYSHFYGGTRYVSLSRNDLKKIDDLKGRSVSAALGTVNVSDINEINRTRKLNISVVPVESLQAAFDMVSDGRVSAFAMDEVLLRTMIAQTAKPDDYTLSQELVTEAQPIGFMMRVNDAEFVSVVNDELAEIYKSPEMPEIYRRWFESPIPGLNINLNLPMSDVVREALGNPKPIQ